MKAKFLGINALKQAFGRVDEAGKELLVQGLELGAIMVHETAVKSLKKRSTGRTYKRGKKIHIASKPGEPPNVDTGELISGLKWEIDRRRMVSAVGTNVEHGIHMEFGTQEVEPRPWLQPAMRQNHKKILKLFSSGSLKRLMRGK